MRGSERERIESLAIPPAWERVWICRDPEGHLQATGYDARGRKQYRYHPRWMEMRNEAKFAELAAFGAALPRIRRRVRRDLRRNEMVRERVLACVVRLLDRSCVRVGNAEYARDNESFGLTTIRNRHVAVEEDEVVLQFRAKSGVERWASVKSGRVASVVRRCAELPGQELFCFLDDEGRTRDVESGHVNDYLREISGGAFTSKHFRTWGGSVIAAESLRALGSGGPGLSDRELKRREVAAIDEAAEQLGNTRAVCRKYYVHPLLFAADADGSLAAAFEEAERASRPRGLRAAERALLRLLTARG